MFPELLNLPIGIQLSLVGGYFGYHFAYVGIRDHHKTIDVAFITLVFGVITAFTYSIVVLVFPEIIAGLAALFFSGFSGFVWRKYLRGWFEADLRNKDLTWSNDDPTALRTITSSTKYLFTQVAVELHDGTWLRCEDTFGFGDSPHGPFTLGQDGDIGIYLTHEEAPKSKKPKAMSDVLSKDWGDRITYIPASQIRRINFRMKPKKLVVS